MCECVSVCVCVKLMCLSVCVCMDWKSKGSVRYRPDADAIKLGGRRTSILTDICNEKLIEQVSEVSHCGQGPTDLLLWAFLSVAWHSLFPGMKKCLPTNQNNFL